ncbi:AmmeMemoRadiSam system radical SAM enzyme [Natroniella sulfidigena]|uniref:AmmeMemoRadiSam system radical SAM enzyme n=1 Tax=Natroniella sulfidigena TaxID=723921 RepID=UPI00200A568E|nr:AmmeMemoRadiSam system radical SAM enzyme [Natroniella sulfidigena]
MKEALYYRQEGNAVRCQLCPHACLLMEGEQGECQVREVKEGKLRASTYQRVSAVAMDPIEKKPLFHFQPGSQILSLGTVGCNLKCKFCQNYKIAHEPRRDTEELSSQQAVELALAKDSIGLAYTYSEPLVWYEYVLETAKLARQEGLKNVLITNGMINPQPLKELLPYIDAINLDLKSFADEFYQRICAGKLNPVKKTVELTYKTTLLEITTLLIPGLNDSKAEIKQLVDWIADFDCQIPVHFARYFPRYQLHKEPTPVEKLLEAKNIAEEKLDYVYLGNIPNEQHRTTYCPDCKYPVIQRGHNQVQVKLVDKSCPECGTKIKVSL